MLRVQWWWVIALHADYYEQSNTMCVFVRVCVYVCVRVCKQTDTLY